MSPFGPVPELIPRNDVQPRVLVTAAAVIDAGAAKFVLEFVEGIPGAFACARCPAWKCCRWFVLRGGRSNRQYCSPPYCMRA